MSKTSYQSGKTLDNRCFFCYSQDVRWRGRNLDFSTPISTTNLDKEDDAMADKAVTPSKTITNEQIGKINDLAAAQLRKSDLPSDLVQEILKTQGGELATNLVADLRRRVEAISDLIVRTVTVDRSLTGKAALDATGRNQYTDSDVVATMPQGEGDEVEIVFFKLGRYISDDELDKEYDLRGLIPVDPHALAALNAADKDFADERPNATHWQDANSKWCYAAFSRWGDDGRRVSVRRGDSGWNGPWWFAGRRK